MLFPVQCIPITSLKPPQALLSQADPPDACEHPRTKGFCEDEAGVRGGSAEATSGTCAAAPDPKGCTGMVEKIDDDEGSPSGCTLAPQIDGLRNELRIMAKFRLQWPGAERQQP